MVNQSWLVAAILATISLTGCQKAREQPPAKSASDDKQAAATDPASQESTRTPVGRISAITLGMTLEQASAVLGRPSSSIATKAGEEEGETAEWRQGSWRVSVEFREGKVISTLALDLDPKVQEAVAGFAAKFDGIAADSSPAAVMKVLGPPWKRSCSSKENVTLEVFTWKKSDRIYVLQFTDGRLQKSTP